MRRLALWLSTLLFLLPLTGFAQTEIHENLKIPVRYVLTYRKTGQHSVRKVVRKTLQVRIDAYKSSTLGNSLLIKAVAQRVPCTVYELGRNPRIKKAIIGGYFNPKSPSCEPVDLVTINNHHIAASRRDLGRPILLLSRSELRIIRPAKKAKVRIPYGFDALAGDNQMQRPNDPTERRFLCFRDPSGKPARSICRRSSNYWIMIVQVSKAVFSDCQALYTALKVSKAYINWDSGNSCNDKKTKAKVQLTVQSLVSQVARR